MLNVISANYDAPAIAARVMEFRNNGNTDPVVIVENQDAAATAAIRFQESDDGVTWTDIADTSATVGVSGDQIQTTINSARARIALHAGGNVRLLVTVIRNVQGSPSNLGAV